MQANRRLVQHIADALQIAAQLRGQADALRLTAAQGRGAAVQRQVAQAHFLHELQAALDLRDQVARDVALAFGEAAHQLQGLDPLAHVGHRQARHIGDADTGKLHRTGCGVQARAMAGRAGSVDQVFHIGLGKGLLAALVVVVLDRVVKHLALIAGQRHTSAHAVRAPAVLAVVAEQARVQLGIRRGANRAGTLGGEGLQFADVRRQGAVLHRLAQAAQIT